MDFNPLTKQRKALKQHRYLHPSTCRGLVRF